LEDEQLRKTQKIIEIPRPQENLNADSVKENEKSEIDQEMEERWNMKNISWREKSAGQKSVTILKTFVFWFALFVAMVYFFGSSFLGEQSIFLYIVNGNWEKVFSIFSVTACFMEICVIVVCVSVLEKMLFWIARVSNSKGETICHLTSSFVKYVSVIVALYDCFAQFGVDTQTLLASAGILSLVIGLALKDILTDIIAGLFIILEDEFRVGDFIDIGSYMGMVKSIGVRSTKIERDGQTKVVNNSDIKGVLNMSGKVGKASCTIGIGYEEPLERVEEILRKELPLMKDRLPGALKEPKYKGVSELGDNSVNLKISVDCVGPLRRKTMRALNREMKLLFDRYHINIPYPQIVINQPVVYEDIGLDEEESV
jgi:small conductance mechanosensitive channel